MQGNWKREQGTVSNLQKMRIKRGMTQAELAKRAGISTAVLARYEIKDRNINRASVSTVIRLAGALHCEIMDIIENESAY